jgi:hypothetical protein
MTLPNVVGHYLRWFELRRRKQVFGFSEADFSTSRLQRFSQSTALMRQILGLVRDQRLKTPAVAPEVILEKLREESELAGTPLQPAPLGEESFPPEASGDSPI